MRSFVLAWIASLAFSLGALQPVILLARVILAIILLPGENSLLPKMIQRFVMTDLQVTPCLFVVVCDWGHYVYNAIMLVKL